MRNAAPSRCLAALALLAAACEPPREPSVAPAPRAPIRIAAAPVLASPPTPLRDAPPAANHRVIVRAARLLDVRTGRVLTDQSIAILDDKIVRVAPSAQLPAAPGTEVIDLGDQTLLPGLIDMHVHLTWSRSASRASGAAGERRASLPREALVGARNARVTLDAGFTTVRNLGANGWSDVALRDAIDEGELVGPRVVPAGTTLGITGAHCDDAPGASDAPPSPPDGSADGVPEVQKKVREQIMEGADVIDVCATGGVLARGDDPRASQYSPEELRAIVADAHRLGRRVAADAHGGEGLRVAVEAGVDTIEHATYIDDAAIALMKARGTYLVPALSALSDALSDDAAARLPPDALAKAREVASHGLAARAKALKAGVRFAFGTDAAVSPHGTNARELGSLVKMGMTPLQAIQSATVNAADALGWSDHVGAAEPGKWGDLIAVQGDPLADVTTLEHVTFVMKGGRVYKNERGPIESAPWSPPPPRKDAPPLHIDSDPEKPPADRM